MSKASRRRRTPGSPPPASRSTGSPPPSGAPPRPAASPSGGATPASNQAASGATSRSGASATAGTAGRPSGTGTSRPSGTTTRPTGSRAGRRERQRIAYQPSFFERYRTPIIVVAAVLGVALISVFVLFSASQPAYACSTIWSPTPTASPKPGATPALGYVQPDMGHVHTAPGDKVTYTYCAPASGTHYNVAGRGPIAAQVYGPGDNVIPQGWIHNLEHGGLVILYKTTSSGATPEGQAQMRAFFQAFPPAANCGPVIAPFDQMSSPFQAILWGRVLPLETFDEAQIKAFWNQWGGLTNLEPLCPTPNSRTSPSPGASAVPSVSAVPSTSTTPSASPATSAGPVAPSASPAASPS